MATKQTRSKYSTLDAYEKNGADSEDCIIKRRRMKCRETSGVLREKETPFGLWCYVVRNDVERRTENGTQNECSRNEKVTGKYKRPT